MTFAASSPAARGGTPSALARRSRTTLALAAGLVWGLALPGAALRAETLEGVGPEDARLDVSVDRPASEPFEQEMLLVRIRGTYTVTMTLETLEQPSMPDFAWMQLGRDRWSEVKVEGRSARRFERVMAVFPRRAGVLTLPPFLHRLTLLTPDGGRARHDVVSDPVELAVRAPSGSGWWLPARGLALTDATDRDPTALGIGDTATRTVTLEAAGVSADRLPPMPALAAPGVVALAMPESRETRSTPEGPVARVTWTWRLKPLGSATAELPSVTIPWFDTVARTTRSVVLPPLAVGRAAAPAPGPDWRAALLRNGPLAVAAAGALGLALGAALLLSGLVGRRRRPFAGGAIGRLLRRAGLDATTRALGRAARRGDTAAFRTALAAAARERPRGPEAALLSALDRSLYAAGAGPVDLPAVLAGLRSARRGGPAALSRRGR